MEPKQTLDSCIEAYEQSQRLRMRGDLIAARAALVTCSRDACPAIAKSDCIQWLAEVRRELPTIVLGARFEDGRDAIQVRVVLDDKPLVQQLDGKAVEVNPGIHSLRFDAPGRPPVIERVSIRLGERNRRVVVMLPPSEQGASPTGQPIPTMTYVLGSVGLIGLAGFGYFASSGLSKESDLDRCKPVCPANQVNAVRNRYLAADISLAVGALAIGSAAYLYLADSHARQERGTVGLGVRVGPRQLAAAVSTDF